MGNNELKKYEGSLVQRVGDAISVTNKLLTLNDKPQRKITNQTRSDWNNYVNFLRSKGMAGNPDLDKNRLGKKYLADYIKANPKTSLTMDIVSPIQTDLLNLKAYSLQQLKTGKAIFQKGTNYDNFMNDLSDSDGYPGSKTTSHVFPNEFMRYIDLQNNTDLT